MKLFLQAGRFFNLIFLAVEVLVLGATIVLAVLWIRYPDRNFDGLALLSGTVLGVLELLRRLVVPEDRNQKLEQLIVALSKSVTQPHAPESKASAPVLTPPVANAITDPVFERIRTVIELREQVIEKMKTLAELKGISTDQEPTAIASQLAIPELFQKALRDFLDYATDFKSESQPMSEWAADHARIVLTTLDMFISNATTVPAP